MNPPSALHSAMNRERKPFTYTPGGLDLSEIKSERMAKRLMRNAMNEGVPQIPVQQVQSPPANTIAVPNFNCLPVQVFPTFNLPANPKSLLRTRSNPSQPKEPIVPKVQQTQLPKPNRTENTTSFYSPVNNNNASYQRPTSMYEYNAQPNNSNTLPRMSYGSTDPVSYLPEMSYEAEYLRAAPRDSNGFNNPTIQPVFKSDKPLDSKESAFVNVKLKENSSIGESIKPTNALFNFDYTAPSVDLKQTSDSINTKNIAFPHFESNQSNDSDKTKATDILIDSGYISSTHSREDDLKSNVEATDVNSEKTVSFNLNSNETTNVENTVEVTNKQDDSDDTTLTCNVTLKPQSNIDNSENTTKVSIKSESATPTFNFELKDPKDSEKGADVSINLENETSDDSNIDLDFSIEPISLPRISPSFETKAVEDYTRLEDEQKEVKVVKKVKKESKSEVQNGDQNGDSEAQLTVKLPTKKSAAKTETKVEVVKKQLPDGSIEEVKTTITKTTVDGKTTIATKTETTIIPKEDEEEEEYEEEEEQEEESGEVVVEEVKENGNAEVTEEVVIKKPSTTVQNGEKTKIVTEEERSETTVTKKVAVVQKQETEEEEEEEEEVEEEVQQKVEPKKVEPKEEPKVEKEEVQVEEEEVEEEVEEKVEVKKEEVKVEEEEEEEEEVEEPAQPEKKEEPEKAAEVEEEQVEEEFEEAEEKVEEKVEKTEESKQKDEESEYTEEEYESEKEEVVKTAPEPAQEEPKPKEPEKEVIKEEEKKEVEETKEVKPEPEPQPQPQPKVEPSVPLREPSIPLEKVEDVEIKPIGAASETITKSHTQNTEIITSNERPSGPISTQTEYNRIENIVTVNRTTKTLDSTYEQLTQQGIPTVKTYFAPGRDRISTSPQPAKPYQPVYPPAPAQPQERRHSLLLERLSMERQVPSSDLYQNNYQYSNQTVDQQRQWSQEPQAEVLTVSNVKPSTITNSQWYQQNQSRKENVLYNNVTTPTPAAAPSLPWNQSYLSPQTPLPPQTPIQPQAQPQAQYQPIYTDNNTNTTYQQNNYQPYTPKPSTWGSNTYSTDTQLSSSYNTQQNQYSLRNQTTESYQKSSQQYSSSYVPPPWEQDSSYVADTSNQNYYQPPPQTSSYAPSSNQGWTPAPPKSKFSKPPPTAYIPPAPNQSFVKHVNAVEPPRVPGKKTYYSEYERRYITVPESNYIPGESKYQPQPDPSPQYYYDNNEPVETSEPQWRKELREFTEKTSSQTTEQTSVKPPWEEDSKYAKPPPSSTYTPTPTWSQTLRPNSYRERSFESEYVGSQEFKTNTLGRGRPLSTYAKSNVDPIPERVRGVSVDRYNPNSYQAPVVAEHPPVQTHTLVPPAKSYHNPNVPAYHAQSRASAEPREQPIYPQSRQYADARASPLQSRSFKYLQWITGTED
ncbi:titin-like isoform X1 [Ostrinia nubilalis]|uniref:titin-like isoform X1 n=1 Tax=Ostrinia nubilalis TaxID=29057 RepID=UPI003082539A